MNYPKSQFNMLDYLTNYLYNWEVFSERETIYNFSNEYIITIVSSDTGFKPTYEEVDLAFRSVYAKLVKGSLVHNSQINL